MILSNENILKKTHSKSYLVENMDYVLFYYPRTSYISFFKNELLINEELLIKELSLKLVFPSFESKYLGIVSPEKNNETSIEEAIETALITLNESLTFYEKTYKKYNAFTAFICKKMNKGYPTKEDFEKFKKSILRAKESFSDVNTALETINKYNPDIIPENFMLKDSYDFLSFESIENFNVYKVNENNGAFFIDEYTNLESYYTEDYNKDNPYDFVPLFELKNKSGQSITLKIGKDNKIIDYHNNMELFFSKEDAIEKIKEIHSKNQKYLDNI